MTISLLQWNKRRRNRFDLYIPHGDLAKLDLTGVTCNENDYDLGTASLNRRENITLLASNSSKQALFVSIKWRPCKEPGFVTLATRFELEFDGNSYEHEQIITYQPTTSTVRLNRITQYGGEQSSVKFYISSPYRRMRLSFCGHMRSKTDSEAASKFVKAGFVISCTSGNFDFLEECNTKFLTEQHSRNKLSCNFKETLNGLVLQDRHEHLVQIKGDFTIFDGPENSSRKLKKRFYGWGFSIRQFLEDKSQKLETKRVLAHFVNSRAFHVTQSSSSLGSIDFGYAYLSLEPSAKTIDRGLTINWTKIDDKTQEFELNIYSEGLALSSKANKRGELSRLFDIELDGKVGWAWILCNDAIESQIEEDAIEKSGREFQEALRAGKSARLVTYKGNYDTKTPLIVSIDDEMCVCSDLVGAKASSLAQLLALSKNSKPNYIVPGGLVLTKFAHDAILEANSSLKSELNRLEWLIGEGDLSTLKGECERLQKLIQAATLPDHLRQELGACLTNNYSDLEARSFAVRSSSWGEDENDMSAAGQLTTVLGVRGLDQLLEAVMTCFASKFTVANIEYKRQHGLPAGLPMAVVIQEMVDCEKAGVLFTCDPTTGDDSLIIITANYGLGESVVSGQSEPDSIIVRAHGQEPKIEEVSVGAKKIIIDSGTLNGEDGMQDHYDRSRCCLSDDEIICLAKCGQSIAYHFRCPRDIEWGYKSKQLYLLQSRPVTGLDNYSEFELMHEADQPLRAEIDFCTRANIGEVMPYAMTPFTYSFIVRSWLVLGFRCFSKFFADIVYCPSCSKDTLYVAYHTFFALRGSAIFAFAGQGEKSLMSKSIEIGFFGREIEDPSEIVESSKGFKPQPNPFEGFRYDFHTMGLRLMPISKVLKDRHIISNLRSDVRALKFVGSEENLLLGLFNQLKYTLKLSETLWENHILVIMLGNKRNMAMSGILSKYIKDPVRLCAAITKFLAISPDVISAEIPKRIRDISNLIKQKEEAEVEKFVSMRPDDGLKYIENGDEKVAREFNNFINRFGHRCYNEFEMSELSWGENRMQIVEMIQKNCKVVDRQASQNTKLSTIDEVIDSLSLTNMSAKDKITLKYFIAPGAQTWVSARELTKDALVEHADAVRVASRLLAKELRKNLRLPDENLFYYLFIDEIEPLIREPQPSIVVQATRRRNMFNSCFKEPWKYDEIIRDYDFTPNHLKPSKELDEKLANAPKLYGTPASSGRVQAKVCLVDGYKELDNVRAGDILLTHSTDIAFSPVFPLIAGIITEVGGLISHGAVVAREYGLPSILGIPDVTRILQDGEEIILDADSGTIIRLSKGGAE